MKLDLFGKEWLDLVFEGRNKSYGAYLLRAKTTRVMMLSLVIGAFSFTLLAWVAKEVFLGKPEKDLVFKELDNGLYPRPVNVTKVLLPAVPEPIVKKQGATANNKSVLKQVKHTKYVPVTANEANEVIAKTEDLNNVLTGSSTIEGSADGGVVLGETGTETGGADGNVTGIVDEPVINAGLEVPAAYPGGIRAFYEFIARNYKSEHINGLNVKGQLTINFIVERDGSLSDIIIARDLGYGAGAEVVRVLKMAKKWNPGIQNGRPVRVKYSLPIKIDVKK